VRYELFLDVYCNEITCETMLDAPVVPEAIGNTDMQSSTISDEQTDLLQQVASDLSDEQGYQCDRLKIMIRVLIIIHIYR